LCLLVTNYKEDAGVILAGRAETNQHENYNIDYSTPHPSRVAPVFHAASAKLTAAQAGSMPVAAAVEVYLQWGRECSSSRGAFGLADDSTVIVHCEKHLRCSMSCVAGRGSSTILVAAAVDV
jgi:hypothetical protein